MATIEKRGNSYRITVSAGYDSAGKQIRKKMTWTPAPGMTKKQIEKELNKQAVTFEQQVETGQFLNGTITFAEFAEKWFSDYAEKQLKASTLTGYRNLMPRILQAIGHIKLAKLQPHHLMEFYNNLGEDGIRLDIKYRAVDDFLYIMRQKKYTQQSIAAAAGVSLQCVRSCCTGKNVTAQTAQKIAAVLDDNKLFIPVDINKKLSGSTLAKYHHLISIILTKAVQWQVVPFNVCERVEPPHVKYKEAAVLDEKEVSKLIDCLNSEPLKYKTAIMLILYTGMRRGEICGLDWSDIDFKNGVVHISKAILYTPDKGVYQDTPKTNQSDRVVNIPADMTVLLKAYKREQSQTAFELGDQWEYSGKVFTSDSGGIIRPDNLSQWFKKFLKRHELPDIHLHTLRHTSATMLIAGGIDVATVSSRLGHANKTTTLNIYTHAIKSADAIAAEKLQDMLSPMKRYKAV